MESMGQFDKTPRDFEMKDGAIQSYMRNNEFTNYSKGQFYAKDHQK